MAAPLWNKIAPDYKLAWDDFFRRTHSDNLPSLTNLDQITRLADKITSALQKINPLDEQRMIPAKQWHLDQLSRIKYRVALAIDQKRNYYNKTIWGRITKLVLKLFGLWNNGTTACIRRAEEFLLKHDSRYPLIGSYPASGFSFGDRKINIDWVQEQLDLRNFYNYDPNRAVEVRGGNNRVMPRFMVAVASR